MARKPEVAKPDSFNLIQFRIPGWLKNDIIKHCRKQKVSLNAWMIEVIRAALREERGVPQPPPAEAPIVSLSDELLSYATGIPLVAPCGEPSPCRGVEKGNFFEHGGMSFCVVCERRVV